MLMELRSDKLTLCRNAIDRLCPPFEAGRSVQREQLDFQCVGPI